MTVQAELEQHEQVRAQVRAGYAQIAQQQQPSGCGCGCSGADADQLAATIGYSAEDLAKLPEGANMGLSCGNPVALSGVRAGETVLDLGAGGGFDVFIAGVKAGAAGRVIGVDMTPEMLARARRNQAAYRQNTGLDNVEFRLGEIEHLPVADAGVDVVISNCVINLSPDKAQVWREIARVLKPGGRVAVSDIVLKKPLPDALREDVRALVGCVAGAMLIDDLREAIYAAGLLDVKIEEKPGYVENLATTANDAAKIVAVALPAGDRPADYFASMNISARKAERKGCC